MSIFYQNIWLYFNVCVSDNCSYDFMEEQAKDWLDNVYTPTNFEYAINATQTSWEYNTNINDETSAAKVCIRILDILAKTQKCHII